MKKLFVLAVFISLSIGLSSCAKKAERDITVTHKLAYNGAPLVMLTPYQYPDGRSIQFTKVSYYMSDLRVTGGNESVTLKDVDLVNFANSNTDQAGAEAGIVQKFTKVDINTVDNIKFNMGLTKEQNAKTPDQFSAGHPLALSGEYWGGWKSYVFAKIEGTIDLDNDGTREQTFAFHLGSDQILRAVTVLIGDTSTEDTPVTLTVASDLYKVFSKNVIYDIDSRSNIHSPDHLREANQLIDNWATTLSFLK